jgi:hypothetical protein
VKKHKKFFGGEDDDQEADSGGMGAAAAMQALKMFSSGEGGQKQSQGAFMAIAMSEASKVRTMLCPSAPFLAQMGKMPFVANTSRFSPSSSTTRLHRARWHPERARSRLCSLPARWR